MVLTRDELCRFFADRFGLAAADLDDGARLFSDGLLDSFSMVELIAHLEKVEGIRIGAMEVQLENLDSIERILRFVATKTGAGS
jgi:acyl carrier protein